MEIYFTFIPELLLIPFRNLPRLPFCNVHCWPFIISQWGISLHYYFSRSHLESYCTSMLVHPMVSSMATFMLHLPLNY